MSSSDSEEDLDKFREAVDFQFASKTTPSKENAAKKMPTSEIKEELPPSLRRTDTNDDNTFNLFKVSPEFQKYVAKQLSELLEKHLEQILDCTEKKRVKKRKVKGGIRLLKSSNVIIAKSDVELDIEQKNDETIQRRVEVEFDDEEVEEKCKTVAVSCDDVLNKYGMKYWTNKPSAKVFNYKKRKGRLELQEASFEEMKKKFSK